MKSYGIVSVLTLILALCLLLSACGGSGSGGSGGVNTGTDGTGTDDSSDVESGASGGGVHGGVQGGAADDVKDELKSFFSKSPEYMVTYEMSGPQLEGPAEYTLYLTGEKMRMDFVADDGEMTVESRTLVLENKFIMCTRDGEWTCMQLPTEEGENAAPQDLTQGFDEVAEDLDDMDILFLDERKIAGATAKCYQMAWAAGSLSDGSLSDSTSYEVCYSKEGVPLYLAFETPEGSMVQEATSYKTSVSASDFEPPAEPQDLEAMMGQMMQQYS